MLGSAEQFLRLTTCHEKSVVEVRKRFLLSVPHWPPAIEAKIVLANDRVVAMLPLNPGRHRQPLSLDTKLGLRELNDRKLAESGSA
jgi:hypothetical protein